VPKWKRTGGQNKTLIVSFRFGSITIIIVFSINPFENFRERVLSKWLSSPSCFQEDISEYFPRDDETFTRTFRPSRLYVLQSLICITKITLICFEVFSLRIAFFLWTLKIIPDDLEIRTPEHYSKLLSSVLHGANTLGKLLGLVQHNMYSRLPPTFPRIRWNVSRFCPHRFAENNPGLIAKFTKQKFSCKLFHIMKIANIISIPFTFAFTCVYVRLRMAFLSIINRKNGFF